MTDEEIELALQNCTITIKENNCMSLSCEVRLKIIDGQVRLRFSKGYPRKYGDEWYNWCSSLEKIDAEIFKRILSYNKKNDVVVYVKYREPEIGHIWQDTETQDKFVFIAWIGGSEDFVALSYKTKTIRLFDRTAPMPKKYKLIGKSVLDLFDLFKAEEIEFDFD